MKPDFLHSVPYVCQRWKTLAEENPSAIFLTEEESGESYTRCQVDELSARVYAYLLKKGIGTEDFVLIRMPRGALPFIAMLGVWKAGAAFTVVEDDYAPERIDAIAKDCACALTLDLSAWEAILQAEPQAGFREAQEHDACFAIYTSGSTGKPKGVLQEYGKIKLNQASLEKHPGDLLQENDCIALTAPINFIAAVKIFLNALYSGMHVVVFSTDTARNPMQLNERMKQYQVTQAFLSPSLLRVMADGPAPTLRTLVTGSEAANGIFFEGVRLINNYGMSEAGFHVSQFEIDRRYDVTPIGKPVFDDICIRLLDENGNEIPDGQEGEVCFENPFFRGYIHLPEETEKALRDGIFHSGDMGKRLPDGNLVITGRLNTMVKINGNRVEPGEIEAVLRRIPGIKNAAIRDFKGERQQVFLCAYYVAENDLTEEEIRTCLQRELPHYMIPAFFTRMDTIPINPNGKVNRFALPKPDVNAKSRAYAPPETEEEAAICVAFETVLKVDKVGVNEDFFSLGGDSLSTALATAELVELGVDYKDLYAWKTPRQIAAHLSEKTISDLDALNRAALSRDQYLTPYQTFFYDADLYSPYQTNLNNPFSLSFPKGRVDPLRLKHALEAVFSNYAFFSSVCSHDDEGSPVLHHLPGKIVHPEIREVREHTPDMLAELIQPYHLDGELLYRCVLYVTPTRVIMDFDTFHLISDGSSIANFISEVFAAYRGEPLRQDHYYYYLENQYLRRMELEHDADARLLLERFSRTEYRCNPQPDLISRRTGNGQYMSRTSSTLGEIQKGCEALKTSMNKLFVAAALVALSKISGDDKVSVEWTYHGRDENWKNDLIGMTIASVPVAVDMADIRNPQDLLREINEQNELGMRYADLSLGNNGVTPGDRDRIVVVYETGFDMQAFLPEGTEMMSAYDRLNGAFTRCQIILFSTTDPDGPIPFYINYDSELYSSALIGHYCEHFDNALSRMIAKGMRAAVMKRYITNGLQALDRMEEASRHGSSVSEELLMHLVRDNQDTEYGQKYHFREIQSYADFAAKVPFSSYEDYEPYIEQMLCFNQKNLITADDVVYYAHTSGTTGTSKMIPCTKKSLDTFFSTGYERIFGMYERSRREKGDEGMPTCKGMVMMESRIGYTPYSIAHGAISETVLHSEDIAHYNALPEELIYPKAEFDRRHVKMLFALRERRLSFMMCSFAPFLYDMITYLRQHWQVLCEDLALGRICPDIAVDPALRKKLDARLTPDPARADEIRTIMSAHEEEAFVPLLWPDMKLVATIGSASFAPYLEKLRQYLGPEPEVDYLGYVSSEATIGAPIRENEGEYMLLPFSGFYEFIPMEDGASETPLLMHQLEVRKEYELIVTNLSGFYRYRLGDVVRVTGYHNECPMLVVSYRKNQLISMYGEKVTETTLQNALEAMEEESGTNIPEYSVYADSSSDPGHYVVLLESDREIPREHWPFYSEILNRKLCEMHDSYRLKIQQKIMLPLEVKFVQPQTYALYRDLKVMGGASPNQIKPIHVIPDGRLKRFFFGLLQD